jgi:hypothetical protein
LCYELTGFSFDLNALLVPRFAVLLDWIRGFFSSQDHANRKSFYHNYNNNNRLTLIVIQIFTPKCNQERKKNRCIWGITSQYFLKKNRVLFFSFFHFNMNSHFIPHTFLWKEVFFSFILFLLFMIRFEIILVSYNTFNRILPSSSHYKRDLNDLHWCMMRHV